MPELYAYSWQASNTQVAATSFVSTTSASLGATVARASLSFFGRSLTHKWRFASTTSASSGVTVARALLAIFGRPLKRKWQLQTSSARVRALRIQHFFDDFRLLETDHAVGEAMKIMKEASWLFGIVFDEREDQGPCLVLPFLGNLKGYSRESHDEVVLAIYKIITHRSTA